MIEGNVCSSYSMRTRSITKDVYQEKFCYQCQSFSCYYQPKNMCTRYLLRSHAREKNHQNVKCDKSIILITKHSLKFHKKNLGKSLQIRKVKKCLDRLNIENSKKDSKEKTNTQNRVKEKPPLATKKEQYTYWLRSETAKNCSGISDIENNESSERRSDKVKYRNKSPFKSNIETRKDCNNKAKKKECDKLQEKIKIKSCIIKKYRKQATKKTNISVAKLKNTPKSKDRLGIDNSNFKNIIENASFDENILIGYKEYLQSKTTKKKNCKPYYRSGSFERYGVFFPSYEKVLDNINKVREEADALDAYEEEYGNLDNSLPLPLQNNDNLESQEEPNLKGCEYLSEHKLQEYFQQNLHYIRNILNGKSRSQRHEKFKHYDPKTHLTMDDLTYSPSIVVFTSNQRDLLLRLLENQFDPEGKKTDYLFKVLLPELCLKIFMDVYEMTGEEAIDYLNRRPLD